MNFRNVHVSTWIAVGIFGFLVCLTRARGDEPSTVMIVFLALWLFILAAEATEWL